MSRLEAFLPSTAVTLNTLAYNTRATVSLINYMRQGVSRRLCSPMVVSRLSFAYLHVCISSFLRLYLEILGSRSFASADG